jgi:hypothetical protein
MGGPIAASYLERALNWKFHLNGAMLWWAFINSRKIRTALSGLFNPYTADAAMLLFLWGRSQNL